MPSNLKQFYRVRFFYTIIIILLLPFALLRLYFLGFKDPAYRLRWCERFGLSDRKKYEKPVIWLHAVSVGEVNAATPVLNRLLKDYPDHQIIVTTVTPTGGRTLQRHFSEAIKRSYFPYDIPLFIRWFLNAIRPSLLIIMETEIWPNLCYECKQRNIPVVLINARLSERSARKYSFLTSLTQATLARIDMIAAQTEADAERFALLGMARDRLHVTGNLKFDVSVPQDIATQAAALNEYFSNNRKIWIAASTHAGEDETVLDAHYKVLKDYPGAVLILAPRHPERASKVQSSCLERNLRCCKRTDKQPFTIDDQVYILNVLGELQAHYAVSKVAFVGGSLVDRGGQNMLEPASMGIPVLAGPFIYNFAEIATLLKNAGGLYEVQSAAELSKQVCRFFKDTRLRYDAGEKALQVINYNKGSVPRLMGLLEPYLGKCATKTKI